MTDTTVPAGARNPHEERFARSLTSLLYETGEPTDAAAGLVATAVARALDECRLHLAAGRLGHTHDDPEPEPDDAGGEAADGAVSDDERLRECADLFAACHEEASRASVRMVGAGRIGLAVRAMQTATDALIALHDLHALDALTPHHDADTTRKEGE